MVSALAPSAPSKSAAREAQPVQRDARLTECEGCVGLTLLTPRLPPHGHASHQLPLPLSLRLLLSRDLHFLCRDLHSAAGPDIATVATQLVLPGFDPPVTRSFQEGRRPVRACRRVAIPDDNFVRTYLRRLASHGAAAKGIGAYRYQLRATVRAASRITGSPLDVAGLFRDPALLGSALVDDRSAHGSRLSKWTLAQRRSAIRSVATLMRPELLALLGEEPDAVVDHALRHVAQRVGSGYRLTGGAPRRRGGYAPGRDEVAAVLCALDRARGFAGIRNRAFFGILAATGCRVNALRQLDGRDCLVLPNGRVRLYLHDKGKAERREVELSADAAGTLWGYAEAFNQHAAARRWRARIRPGELGAVWRNDLGRRWGHAAVLKTLRDGCLNARVPPFAPHALRRAFATDAASRLPRHVVAQAGGWKGLERLDDHYVRPREPRIWEKLSRHSRHDSSDPFELGATDAAAVAL